MILIKGAGNEELLAPPPSKCQCPPLRNPNCTGCKAKSPLGWAGPHLSHSALRGHARPLCRRCHNCSD